MECKLYIVESLELNAYVNNFIIHNEIILRHGGGGARETKAETCLSSKLLRKQPLPNDIAFSSFFTQWKSNQLNIKHLYALASGTDPRQSGKTNCIVGNIMDRHCLVPRPNDSARPMHFESLGRNGFVSDCIDRERLWRRRAGTATAAKNVTFFLFRWKWGTQIGEVTLGGSPDLSCKWDQIKMRDFMDRRFTSPTWGPPPPSKQALKKRVRAVSKFITLVPFHTICLILGNSSTVESKVESCI